MVVRFCSGRDSMIQPVFMIILNRYRKYPMKEVPDDTSGVSYRTCPKRWMDAKVILEWLYEPRAISKLPNGGKRAVYVDNCSGHGDTEHLRTALKDVNTGIGYLPKKSLASYDH